MRNARSHIHFHAWHQKEAENTKRLQEFTTARFSTGITLLIVFLHGVEIATSWDNLPVSCWRSEMPKCTIKMWRIHLHESETTSLYSKLSLSIYFIFEHFINFALELYRTGHVPCYSQLICSVGFTIDLLSNKSLVRIDLQQCYTICQCAFLCPWVGIRKKEASQSNVSTQIAPYYLPYSIRLLRDMRSKPVQWWACCQKSCGNLHIHI